MSDQSPYEKLGLAEEASFEEIQEAKARLIEQSSGDRKQIELIEAAYDAVLMERLRLRREGKIKVPDRIRFPEKLAEVTPNPAPVPTARSPQWLQQFIDTPSKADILMPMGVFVALIAFSAFASPASLQIALLVGLGSSIYFLNRKEGKFGRSVLLTLAGLFGGLLLGTLIGSGLMAFQAIAPAYGNQFAAIFAFFLLWLVSSFTR